MASFRELKVWQHARRLALACREAADRFPAEERFGLADQLRRAAFAAPLHIAEGHGRRGAADYRRFLIMARASLDEVAAALDLSHDAGYMDHEVYERITAVRDETARTLFGLIRTLDHRLSQKSKP